MGGEGYQRRRFSRCRLQRLCVLFYLYSDALRRVNIPYRIVGGIKFYERKEIKDLLAYVRIVVNPKDSLALSRIINVPTRGIGATSLRKLETEAVNLGLPLFETIDHILSNLSDYSHIRLSAKIKSSLNELNTLLNEVKVMEDSGEYEPSHLYEKILHESGYYEFLKASKDYESLARIENLEELLGAIKQYESTNLKPTLSGFLETVTLGVDFSDCAFYSTYTPPSVASEACRLSPYRCQFSCC